MKNQTFVLQSIDRLPKKGTFKTPDERPAGSRDWQTDPAYTRIKMAARSATEGYDVATVIHRVGLKLQGLWHGDQVKEIVVQKRFTGYYSHRKGLFIGQAEKITVSGAVKRLNKELAKDFALNAIELDFDGITPVATNIIGVWFERKRNNKNVRRESAYGDQLDQTEEYEQMSRQGALTSLAAVIPFKGTDIRARISKSGSVSFLGQYPLKTSLRFLEYLSKFEAKAAETAADRSARKTRR